MILILGVFILVATFAANIKQREFGVVSVDGVRDALTHGGPAVQPAQRRIGQVAHPKTGALNEPTRRMLSIDIDQRQDLVEPLLAVIDSVIRSEERRGG